MQFYALQSLNQSQDSSKEFYLIFFFKKVKLQETGFFRGKTLGDLRTFLEAGKKGKKNMTLLAKPRELPGLFLQKPGVNANPNDRLGLYKLASSI